MIKAAQLYLLFVLRLLCASARTASKSEAQHKEHCSLQEDFDSGGLDHQTVPRHVVIRPKIHNTKPEGLGQLPNKTKDLLMMSMGKKPPMFGMHPSQLVYLKTLGLDLHKTVSILKAAYYSLPPAVRKRLANEPSMRRFLGELMSMPWTQPKKSLLGAKGNLEGMNKIKGQVQSRHPTSNSAAKDQSRNNMDEVSSVHDQAPQKNDLDAELPQNKKLSRFSLATTMVSKTSKATVVANIEPDWDGGCSYNEVTRPHTDAAIEDSCEKVLSSEEKMEEPAADVLMDSDHQKMFHKPSGSLLEARKDVTNSEEVPQANRKANKGSDLVWQELWPTLLRKLHQASQRTGNDVRVQNQQHQFCEPKQHKNIRLGAKRKYGMPRNMQRLRDAMVTQLSSAHLRGRFVDDRNDMVSTWTDITPDPEPAVQIDQDQLTNEIQSEKENALGQTQTIDQLITRPFKSKQRRKLFKATPISRGHAYESEAQSLRSHLRDVETISEGYLDVGSGEHPKVTTIMMDDLEPSMGENEKLGYNSRMMISNKFYPTAISISSPIPQQTKKKPRLKVSSEEVEQSDVRKDMSMRLFDHDEVNVKQGDLRLPGGFSKEYTKLQMSNNRKTSSQRLPFATSMTGYSAYKKGSSKTCIEQNSLEKLSQRTSHVKGLDDVESFGAPAEVATFEINRFLTDPTISANTLVQTAEDMQLDCTAHKLSRLKSSFGQLKSEAYLVIRVQRDLAPLLKAQLQKFVQKAGLLQKRKVAKCAGKGAGG